MRWHRYGGDEMTVLHDPAAALWAKKEEQESRFCWLPLAVHLDDTMHVARWLWNQWISDGQRKFCMESMSIPDEETAANLAAFLGAIHDLGKATPAFQTKKGYHNSPDLDALLLEKLERSGFAGISSLHLISPEISHHTIAGEYLLRHQFQIKDDLGSIVGGHHGKPVDDSLMVDNQAAYSANYYQSEDENSETAKKWKQAQTEVFQWALCASGFEESDELPELSLPAQVIYSGILIMADWIASNSLYFPLVDLDEDTVEDSGDRYRRGISLWQMDRTIQADYDLPLEKRFQHRFGFPPRDFQKVVCQTVDQIAEPGILILEAPMGLGKTEAALAATEALLDKSGSGGMFFGLPTQATSNGMFGRVRQWLENLTEEDNARKSLRLCHGKAALNEEMNELRNAASTQDINLDDRKNGGVFVNEWFSGRKKTALDDYVVGTVDGFLMVALKQKHLALRHLGFSKKVVIIDEVHAYDVYMQQYLEEAITWMGAYGAPVILVSATLPAEKRIKLITVYLRGRGIKRREMRIPPKMQSEDQYPLLSYTDGTSIQVQDDFAVLPDKTVAVHRLSEEHLMEKIEELLSGGGIIGIIVNTVRRAQSLGAECGRKFGPDLVEVLHSAFIATDRVNKENELVRMIGKQGQRPIRKIIIGTQVIEQSLDIDFDVLITDLCPMDLLLQRIGRLHRHETARPDMHQKPQVYVLGTSPELEFETGSKKVYGAYYLIRTQACLPEEIHLPSDIPVLVNRVYGKNDPELTVKNREYYEVARQEKAVIEQNKEQRAKYYRIQNPSGKIRPEMDGCNLIGWLNNPDQSASEEAAAAQVRDSVETIEVIAVQRTEGGYGVFGKAEDLSGRINEPGVAKELAKQTIRLPHYTVVKGGISATIDWLEQYNRRFLHDWQNQPWLAGTLGIIFEEDGWFNLNGVSLKYDSKFGLREVREDGKIQSAG